MENGSIKERAEGIYGKFFVFEDIVGNLFEVWENKDCELKSSRKGAYEPDSYPAFRVSV